MRMAHGLVTRFLGTTAIVMLGVVSAYGQAATSSPHPYGLDPYKPSDAEWLRNYGAVLVGQTPLLDLTTLDPYKPSDRALLRQLGGALPVCCPDWYGPRLAPGPDAARGFHPSAGSAKDRGGNVLMVVTPPAATATVGSSAAAAPSQPPTPMRSAMSPQGNDGVWIRFNGQTWVSAGRAVLLAELPSERIGEYSGSPVYRARGNDDLIYVPAREGMVAPFRRKQ